MQMGMDTHISPCADTCVCVHTHTHIDTHSFFFLSLFFLCHSLTHTHTHTHALAITHFLSLCYAPAVKSQLNNESAALLPFCIEAEELVIGCIEQHTVCASLPAAARSAHMGNRLMRPREYPGTPAHLSLDWGSDRQPCTVANLLFQCISYGKEKKKNLTQTLTTLRSCRSLWFVNGPSQVTAEHNLPQTDLWSVPLLTWLPGGTFIIHPHLNISESPTCIMHSGMSAVRTLYGQLKCEVPGAERVAYDRQQRAELAVHLFSGEDLFSCKSVSRDDRAGSKCVNCKQTMELMIYVSLLL